MSHEQTAATIMIVDDEPDNLNVLGDMLHQDSWDVRAFPQGEMAIKAAQRQPPEIVLMDVRMPGMDGYEVCRRFKADDRLRTIPIIFLSAFSEPTDKMRAFEAGGVDYVTKPFTSAEVLARVQTHVRLHRYQRHLEALIEQRAHDLAEAERQLRVWNTAKHQWLNTLSHDMRTPLVGLFGITDLLFMHVSDSPEISELKAAYATSCARITKLMDDAMTLACMDVAAETIGFEALDLKETLNRALTVFAIEKGAVTIRASLDALKGSQVEGEPNLLMRAFTNILQTAACCVKDGEAILLTTMVTESEAHVVIIFGREGLSPEARETFFDVGGQRKLFKGGGDFGLGAALSLRIVELFQGRITVENGAEQGLVMTCTLPLLQPIHP